MNGQSRNTIIVMSVLLLLAGLAGIALPQIMSIAAALLIGWLLIFAGIIIFYMTWHGFRERWIVWLKPFVLIAVGLLITFHPIAGAAALGLMLFIYFLLDGFSSVGFAWELRSAPGWGWILLKGAISLLLAAVFILGWPFTSIWLVGLFVGVNLFFDGMTLLMLGLAGTRP